MVNKGKLRAIIGIMVMVIPIVLLYIWVLYGYDYFSQKSIIVATVDIEKGTVIDDPKYFKEVQVNVDQLINGYITKEDINSIIGLAATQYIPQNSQLSKAFFKDPNIIIKKDEFVLKVPESWIYAVPSSLRRGDNVLFYEVPRDITEGTSNYNAINTYEETELREILKVIPKASSEPILETTVLYVKDTSNREVIDADSRERHDGTAQISSIEIIGNEENLKKLEDSISKGMRFVVVYK